MLAIGNGESRASIDIDKINGPKVGCNALWRDYHTDYLVCVDRRMVDESIRGKVNLNDTLIYTREDWYDRYQKLPKVRKLPPLPYNGEQRWDELETEWEEGKRERGRERETEGEGERLSERRVQQGGDSAGVRRCLWPGSLNRRRRVCANNELYILIHMGNPSCQRNCRLISFTPTRSSLCF